MKIKRYIKQRAKEVTERLVKGTQVYRDLDNKLRWTEARAERVLKENSELQERTSAISRKLCQVSVQADTNSYDRPSARRHIRIIMDFDHRIIEQGFLHGNDATVIDYIGRDIGARAAEQIRRANFQRWEV